MALRGNTEVRFRPPASRPQHLRIRISYGLMGCTPWNPAPRQKWPRIYSRLAVADVLGSTVRTIKKYLGPNRCQGSLSLAETSWRLEKAVRYRIDGSLRCCSPGFEITGTIHRFQLSASQKDRAWTQTAAISDPMPDLRWVHRIKHPGCSRVRNGTSPSSEIPSRVESEIGILSYADFIVGNRAQDNCAGRGAKAIDHYCLA